MMETRVEPSVTTVVNGRVLQLQPEGEKTACILSAGGRVLVSKFIGTHTRPGDEISFPVGLDSPEATTETYIRKSSRAVRHRDIYQAFIGYAAQPKPDKRCELYVRPEVAHPQLGISDLHLPCKVLRDYFYVAKRGESWDRQPGLY